jgi:hypothetical protein
MLSSSEGKEKAWSEVEEAMRRLREQTAKVEDLFAKLSQDRKTKI